MISSPDLICTDIEGIITFKNNNTTVGFIRYSENGEIEYIFVNPIFRRKGIGKKLLQIVKDKTGKNPTPQAPVSPLGKKLFKFS